MILISNTSTFYQNYRLKLTVEGMVILVMDLEIIN